LYLAGWIETVEQYTPELAMQMRRELADFMCEETRKNIFKDQISPGKSFTAAINDIITSNGRKRWGGNHTYIAFAMKYRINLVIFQGINNGVVKYFFSKKEPSYDEIIDENAPYFVAAYTGENYYQLVLPQ
jgi:hypothetical protein